ncbi:DUF4347 domain-containing protein, partial [Ectopseudomonas mendocina]
MPGVGQAFEVNDMKLPRFFSRQPATTANTAPAALASKLIVGLEPRIMFDASIAAVAHEAAVTIQTDAAQAEPQEAAKTPAAEPALAGDTTGLVGEVNTSGPQAEAAHIVFIDGQVANREQLIASLGTNVEVHILDTESDGLEQIASILEGRQNVASIDILSHGDSGYIYLAGKTYWGNQLDSHADAIGRIGSALAANGDIRFYACNTGSGEAGRIFVDTFTTLSGADVAASSNATGNRTGEDWTLETVSGVVAMDGVVARADLSGYSGSLATITVTDTDATSTAVNGLVSLAEAIQAANTDSSVDGSAAGSGADIIVFHQSLMGQTLRWSSASPLLVTSTITINGDINGDGVSDITLSGDVNNNGIRDAGESAGLQSNTGGNLTVSNLTFQHFSGNSAQGAIRANGGAISVNNSLFSYNAGAVINSAPTAGSSVTVTNTRILNNDLGIVGSTTISGAVRLGGANTHLVENVVIANNTGTYAASGTLVGAGIILFSTTGGSVTLNNITVADNAYSNTGSGSIAAAGIGWVTASNTNPIIRNSIFTNNTVNGVNSEISAGTAYTDTTNLIGASVNFVNRGGNDYRLAATATNAIDQGTLAGAPSQDIRGFDRPRGGGVDIGAYEVYYAVAPQVDLDATAAGNDSSVTFNGSAVAIVPNISITQVDGDTQVSSASLSLSGVLDAGNETLSLTTAQIATAASYGISVSGSGTTAMTLAGVATLAQYEAILSQVRYSNSTPNYTPATRTISVAVGDDVGSTSRTASVVVTPSNAAPVIGNLNGDSTTFTEGGSAVRLDAGSNATVTDADSANFDGGNVTVAITTNGTAGEDVLAIRNEGTGAGQISVSGSTVSYGGIAIGTISSSGTGGASLVVTLNASANAAAVQALIHNLTYANGNDAAPSTAARTVSITVNDGDGGTSTAAQVTVNVIGVNDAPTITATGNNPTYTENGSAVDLFNSVSINTIETGQSITGMTLSVTNLADGSDELLLVDGTSIALLNGNSGTTASNGISYSVSVFSGTATITLSSAGGISATTAQTVVDGMAYRNSSDAPSTATRVITLTSITDNGGTANGGVDTTATSISTSVSVVAVNDAPIVTSSGGASTFTEGGSGTVIDPGLTLSDPDNATLLRATVSINGNFQPGDVLSFSNDGSSMGNITAEYDSGTGVLMLTSSGATATLAQWQAALRSVTYSNGSDAPSTANRTIGFVASDGQNISATATRIVSVTAVNDAPEIAAPASITVTEDVPSAITGISFSDVDAGSADVTVTLSISSGTLSATSGGAVTVGGTASALTLTGSIANINSFIAGSNLSFTTAANATADVTLTVNINDGGNTGNGVALSANETITLQVTAVNDAPTIVAPVTIVVTEDVPGALTGISFADVDAGSSNVTVTFSVPSGTLSATSAGSVTVSGTASALTLTGSLADINAFIAASGVSFTTASNATANVTLTVSIDDGSNSGSGGAQTDTTTVTLTVTAVNDAPVNSVPAAQSVDQDSALVFNSGNGNLISISDVDAGSNIVRVTLTAANGLLTLGNTAGLSFMVGSGSNDGTMTFEGSIADINNALNGLVFSPTGGYNGPAILQITTNDLGSSGSGGPQTDTDTINITVNSLNPRITDVTSSTADDIYKVGDTITIIATFSEAVTVDTAGGIPTLLLETGSVDRIATYVAGSGGNTLTFTYTVQAGDISADLNYQSTTALSLNGATIRGATANDAVLTLPALGDANSLAGNKAIVIDGVAATVSSVSVPADGTYVAGQNLDFTVNLSESVTVNTSGGTPRIAITLDTGGTVYASYVSGSGTSALVFRLTVVDGQMDSNGISLGSSIDANGGTLRDVAGNDTTTTLNTVGSTTGVLVDAVAPEVSAISLDGASPTNATSVTFTVTFSEDVSGVDINDFSLVTSGSVNATLQSLVQIDPRTYQVTVDAITGLGSLGLNLNANGTGIVDAASNAITGGFTDGPTYAIDTNAPTAPVVTSPALTNAPAPMLSGTAEAGSTVTVTIGGATYTTVASGGAWSLDLTTATPAAGSLALNTNGANPVSVTATDAAGNVSSAGSQTLVIDTTAPTTPAVTSPALTNALAPVLSGTAEAGSTVTVTIGGATYTIVASGGAWSLDLATATPAAGSLALDTNGANPVSVTATDTAGNVSSTTTQTLVIDTTAPSVPTLTSPALTNAPAPMLSGTAEAGSTVTVTIGGATYTIVASGGAWNLDLATATPAAGSLALNTNGANPVSVTATDTAGNVSSAGSQ